MKRILLTVTGLAASLALSVSLAMAAPSGGSDVPSTPRTQDSGGKSDSAYPEAVALVKAEKFAKAITLLEKIVEKAPGHADALNYLGYCHRKLRQFEQAHGYYKRALEADPRHLGAHEYLGELHLMQDDLPKAEEMLRKLRALCPAGCEQRDMLQEAIAAHKAGKPAQ